MILWRSVDILPQSQPTAYLRLCTPVLYCKKLLATCVRRPFTTLTTASPFPHPLPPTGHRTSTKKTNTDHLHTSMPTSRGSGGSGELDKLLKAYRAAVVTGMANLAEAAEVKGEGEGEGEGGMERTVGGAREGRRARARMDATAGTRVTRQAMAMRAMERTRTRMGMRVGRRLRTTEMAGGAAMGVAAARLPKAHRQSRPRSQRRSRNPSRSRSPRPRAR